MKLKLLCALALLVGGKVLADGGLNISKEIKTITYVARTSDQHWIFGAKVRRLAKFSTLKATTTHPNPSGFGMHCAPKLFFVNIRDNSDNQMHHR